MKRFKKALLIDDDRINNYLSEEVIKEANITEEVVTLTDGQKALSYLKNLEIPESDTPYKILVLLDLNMPVMDGFEFMDEFKALNLRAEFLIVVLTSSDNHRDKEKIETYNIYNFISKPITEQKLLQALQ